MKHQPPIQARSKAPAIAPSPLRSLVPGICLSLALGTAACAQPAPVSSSWPARQSPPDQATQPGLESARPPAAGESRQAAGSQAVIGLAADLRRALPATQREIVADPAVVLVDDPKPLVRAIEYREGAQRLGVVVVSAGFIDLANHIARACAVDRVQRGYLKHYIQSLSHETGQTRVQPPAATRHPKAQSSDMQNEQSSHFNQIVGAIVAIQMARLQPGQSGPAGGMTAPAEFQRAVTAGIRIALDCGVGVDGVKAFWACLDALPEKPAWAGEFLPANIKLGQLKRELDRMEKKFFAGGL
jgi:hypothetical protein